jgi:outer membrane immunogenic protein
VTPAPQPVTATPFIPVYFYWTGYYVGATIGGALGKETLFDPFAGQVASISFGGFLAGGYTGINYQIGSLVIGGEGDFIGSFFSKGTSTDPAGNTFTGNIFWTSSLAARVGWAFDRLLVFGKAGVAFGYQRVKAVGPAIGDVEGSATSAGWTVGGGVEWAVTEHWIARVEYDYFQFPTRELLLGRPQLLGILPQTGSQVRFDFNEAKVGMAWKF